MKKTFLKPCLLICLVLVITTIAVASVSAFYPPSPPREPKANLKTATSCEITYKAPISDGGCPIINYEIESFDFDTGIWTSRGSSTTLSHEVSMSKKTQTKFRISALNSVGRSEPVETNKVIFDDLIAR